MTNPGYKIAAAFAAIESERAEEQARDRYRAALAAVRLDPPASDPAWDEYEDAIRVLAEMREETQEL